MNTFSLMEDINDKLKILNYETKFCRYSTLYIYPTSTGFSCQSLPPARPKKLRPLTVCGENANKPYVPRGGGVRGGIELGVDLMFC